MLVRHDLHRYLDAVMSKRVKVGNHSVKVPGSVLARRVLGCLLIAGGLLGFLPVVGFWMLPLGLLVLSVDSALVRRWRRRLEVKAGAWLKPRYPRLARWLGFNGESRSGRSDA
jgi:hypothetical protein